MGRGVQPKPQAAGEDINFKAHLVSHINFSWFIFLYLIVLKRCEFEEIRFP